MTELFIPIQGVWAREYARPGTVGGGKARRFPVAFGVGPGSIPAAVDLSAAMCPGALPISLEGYFVDSFGVPVQNPPPPVMYWQANAGKTSFPDNGGVSTDDVWAVGGDLKDNLNLAPLQWQRREARVAGAAFADVDLNSVLFVGKVEYVDPGFCLGAFIDTATGDTGLNNPAMLQRLAEQNSAAGGGQHDVRLATSNTPILVNASGTSYVRCDGAAFIQAGDVGPNPGQLPVDASANTGAIWEQHPSTFVRETNALRGYQGLWGPEFDQVTLVSIDSVIPPGGLSVGPLSIFEVIRAPTHSRWCLWIDDEQHDVVVAHPAGSDLRRPRDIWNAVFAGALQTREGVGSPLPTFSVLSGAFNTFEQTGNLRHLKYLQAATFVEPYDTSTVPIVTFIPQDGGGIN